MKVVFSEILPFSVLVRTAERQLLSNGATRNWVTAFDAKMAAKAFAFASLFCCSSSSLRFDCRQKLSRSPGSPYLEKTSNGQ